VYPLFFTPPFDVVDTKDIKGIIFKGNNWLGDAVMSIPAIVTARKLFPHAKIGLLTRSRLADLYLATDVDEIIPYQDGLASALKSVKGIDPKQYNVAIVFPRSFSSAVLVFAARIPRRIGYETGIRRLVLTDPMPRSSWILGMHRVFYFHNLLSRFMNIHLPPDPPSLHLSTQVKHWAIQQLRAKGIKEGDIVVGFNPGATYGGAKRWPKDRYIELARGIIDRYNAHILLFGVPEEQNLGSQIMSNLTERVHSFTGKTSVLQLAGLISCCNILITNDTGPMHLADALGVPNVAIFGPTDPRVTSPFGRKNTIIYRKVKCSPCLLRECPTDHSCMRLIDVSDVAEAVTKWLG
jgi:heptosyltransferase-2